MALQTPSQPVNYNSPITILKCYINVHIDPVGFLCHPSSMFNSQHYVVLAVTQTK